jgi:hypothetical protein
MRKSHNHLLSRTLRARDNGAADEHPRFAQREAPHNHADQADIGRQSLRLFRPRGLSAAPLGITIAAFRSLVGMLIALTRDI